MKTLRRLIVALPLVFAMNSCKFFVPPTPEPITPNTNHAPVANLVITPESGYAPLTTDISLTGTDQDNDSMTYQVRIDYNEDNTIDETIPADGSFSPNPIKVNKVFSNAGKSIIYGIVKDARGLKSERNIEVIVSEPTVNKLPTANLSINPSSGEYPLKSDISLSGSDSDGNVVGYKLEIDIGEDGTIDKTIPADGSFSPNPISDSETFNSVGNARVYGIVKDNSGGETKTSQGINVTERNDLIPMVTFESSYKVGNNFGFVAQVQNNTKTDIVINNINNPSRDSLEYYIMKINPDNTSTAVLSKPFSDEFSLTLHTGGILKLDYINNKISIYDTDVIYGTIINSTWAQITDPKSILFYLIDQEGFFNHQIPAWNYPLTNAGNYHLETVVKYSMNGNNYQVKLDSNQFQVNQ